MADETPENEADVKSLEQTLADLSKQIADLSRQVARRGQHMIEPVILSKDIVQQAISWLSECNGRWDEVGMFPKIGEAVLISPVDNMPRKVALHLAAGLYVKGQTTAGIRNESGVKLEEGNTIVLNRVLFRNGRTNYLRPPPISILLHEITHAVDPVFEDDYLRLNPPGRQRFSITTQEAYRLPSEQRAFTAMWTEDLRLALINGNKPDPDALISSYCHRLEEFSWFCRECPEFANQNRDHFQEIIQALGQR